MSLEISVRKEREIIIIELKGELSISTAGQLGEYLTEQLEKAKLFILNLSGVKRIGGYNIGQLLTFFKKCREKKIEIRFVLSQNPRVTRAFNTIGLLEILPIRHKLEEAIEELSTSVTTIQ